jgi:hypothetical protein
VLDRAWHPHKTTERINRLWRKIDKTEGKRMKDKGMEKKTVARK